ncbi:MAG: four helix bundle protein [Desulfoferrobacter sp.]
MKYTRFEELPCWQKARELCVEVHKAISRGALAKDFALKDQIWRAAGSCMDNIAEGFDDFSRKEFLKFLGYSLRSASEVQSQLYRALDAQYINEEEFNHLYSIAGECKLQVKSFMKYLRKAV